MAGWFVSTGLNMNLAPVVDVNVNPTSPAIGALDRSFSADPDTVTAHASWFIEEFRNYGIVTTLKHFPGHGSAVGDSHSGFTDVTTTWTSVELDPYNSLLSVNAIDAVMTAHVFNAQLDSVYPATLSAATIDGLLRTQMGYQGVVVSDEMSMRAVSGSYGIDQAAELAVKAGVDILLYNKNLDSTDNSLARRIVDLLERRVQEGAITEARIEQSYARIMSLKDRYLTSVSPSIARTVPGSYRLGNFPNPFNLGTTIVFEIPDRSVVSLTIYNMLGQEVARLVDEELLGGSQSLRWNAHEQPSGVYLCRLEFENHVSTRRLLLLK
jgi:beta-N-acetylhexosaminidase